MSTLMLKDLGDIKVRTLLRARTLIVLRRLDTNRKQEVVQFLLEAELVHSESEREPIVDLDDADLNGVNLTGANLHNAVLARADLDGADLSDVDLSSADLKGADVRKHQLEEARSLQEATMPDGQVLKGVTAPDGPTFEEWLKDQESSLRRPGAAPPRQPTPARYAVSTGPFWGL
jgi:hypothetical protein